MTAASLRLKPHPQGNVQFLIFWSAHSDACPEQCSAPQWAEAVGPMREHALDSAREGLAKPSFPHLPRHAQPERFGIKNAFGGVLPRRTEPARFLSAVSEAGKQRKKGPSLFPPPGERRDHRPGAARSPACLRGLRETPWRTCRRHCRTRSQDSCRLRTRETRVPAGWYPGGGGNCGSTYMSLAQMCLPRGRNQTRQVLRL